MGPATMAGLPAAVAASVCPNALLNMNDWSCSRASISHSGGQAELQPAPGAQRPPAPGQAGLPRRRGGPASRPALAGACVIEHVAHHWSPFASGAGQAMPFRGAATFSAACTTCRSGASIAVGPPGMGTNQTWIMAGVTRFTDPAGQFGWPGADRADHVQPRGQAQVGVHVPLGEAAAGLRGRAVPAW